MNSETRFANREVADLILADFKTGKQAAYIPYANTVSSEMTGDAVYAYGGAGHPKRVTFNGERSGTFKIETQMATQKLYEILTGTDAVDSAEFMRRKEIACTEAGKITMPSAWTNVTVYAQNDDCGTEIAGTVATTVFTATKPADVAVGSTYIVYGIESTTNGVKTIKITSKTFPKAYTIYALTYEKTEDDEVVPYRMKVYKAQPKSQFNMSFSNSGDPATLSIEFDMMADKNNNMLELQILDEQANID